MSEYDNSVNIKEAGKVDRPYHHGDLRAALIQMGLKLLQTRSVDEIGLREVAREVGVSATAVYRHFPDKAAFLGALAEAGMAQLAIAQASASAQAGGGRSGFLAKGLEYVRWAVKNPALFRLIFSCAQPPDVLDKDIESTPDALRGLRNDVSDLLGPGVPTSQQKVATLHAWSLVHGLAQLVLDKQIPLDWALIEHVIQGAEGAFDAIAQD